MWYYRSNSLNTKCQLLFFPGQTTNLIIKQLKPIATNWGPPWFSFIRQRRTRAPSQNTGKWKFLTKWSCQGREPFPTSKHFNLDVNMCMAELGIVYFVDIMAKKNQCTCNMIPKFITGLLTVKLRRVKLSNNAVEFDLCKPFRLQYFHQLQLQFVSGVW